MCFAAPATVPRQAGFSPIFRLVDGQIHIVHTISINASPGRPSPQADDTGVIFR
jgi:hypothetical protein